MGRAGFMLGTIYQPVDLAECQDFVDTDRTYLNTRAKLPNAAFLSIDMTTPVGMVIQLGANVPANFPGAGVANEYYLMTEEIYNAVVAAPANWVDI